MIRRQVLPLLALLPALAGCGTTQTVVRRIRIIARAEVSGKPVEGSTVMEMTWRAPPSGRMYIDIYGEALILELDGRGTVYVLPIALAPDGRFGGSWAYAVLRTFGIPGQGTLENFPAIEAMTGRHPVAGLGSAELPPLMVAFQDESRKDSIFQVKPEEFERRFGSGVKFLGMEFEFTEDSVTEVLAKRLPMLVESDSNNTFPRDPPGKLRPLVKLPFAYKINENLFFRRG